MRKDAVETFVRKAMPEQEYRAARDRFREYYATNLSLMQSAEDAFRNLILLLTSNLEIPAPKVVSRLKDREECIRKFDRKYRAALEEAGKQYEIQDSITDLIALRTICLYKSDVYLVEQILADQFMVVKRTDKSRDLELDHRTFGYKGLHLDLRLDDARGELPEYKPFAHLQFEVQIRSIVQDAWGEVDHKLRYKKQIPAPLQRRIHCLAALFELADQEFEAIRDVTASLEAKAKDADMADEGVPLDAFGFIAVAERHFPTSRFAQPEAIDGFVELLISLKPDFTAADLEQALTNHLQQVEEFKSYLGTLDHRMNPYTQIRHCLYRKDPRTFGSLMFPGARRNFDRWLNYGTVFPDEAEELRKQKRKRQPDGEERPT